MKFFVKILTFTLLIAGIIVVVISGYNKYFKLSYSDKEYGFVIKNQRGWHSIPKKDDVYYSIGTSNELEKDVVSYFGVSPVQHAEGIDEEQKKIFEESCHANTAINNSDFKELSKITINNLSGYVCITEGKPTHVDAKYIQKQYFLINEVDKTYDYILTVTYPKGNIEEENKVNTILTNFHAQ